MVNKSDFLRLCHLAKALANDLDRTQEWPAEQLAAVAQCGFYESFIQSSHGGFAHNNDGLVRCLTQLASSCLTTALLTVQHGGECARVARCTNAKLRRRVLPDLLSGTRFVAVGLSHLYSSQLHLRGVPMKAERTQAGYRLTGKTNWVTGAAYAHFITVGALTVDGTRVIVLVPRSSPGLFVGPRLETTALTSSHTCIVECCEMDVADEWVIEDGRDISDETQRAEPEYFSDAGALALGLARRAIDEIHDRCSREPRLAPIHRSLLEDWTQQERSLNCCSSDIMLIDARTRCASLALRATQALLVATKGRGYAANSLESRLCREALFFLVWGASDEVMAAHWSCLCGHMPDKEAT